MAEGNATSIEQLESMLHEGRISNEEYTRLRDAMLARPAERPKNASRDRLRKSWSDRELGGVCGGIARYYNVNSTRIRVVFLLLVLLTGGAAVWGYLALYLVIPWDQDEQDLIRTGFVRSVIIVLFVLFAAPFTYFLFRYFVILYQ